MEASLPRTLAVIWSSTLLTFMLYKLSYSSTAANFSVAISLYVLRGMAANHRSSADKIIVFLDGVHFMGLTFAHRFSVRCFTLISPYKFPLAGLWNTDRRSSRSADFEMDFNKCRLLQRIRAGLSGCLFYGESPQWRVSLTSDRPLQLRWRTCTGGW